TRGGPREGRVMWSIRRWYKAVLVAGLAAAVGCTHTPSPLRSPSQNLAKSAPSPSDPTAALPLPAASPPGVKAATPETVAAARPPAPAAQMAPERRPGPRRAARPGGAAAPEPAGPRLRPAGVRRPARRRPRRDSAGPGQRSRAGGAGPHPHVGQRGGARP